MMKKLAIISLLLVSVQLNAQVVSSLANSGTGSLRDVIAAAAPGATITFSVTGTITLTSGISFSKDLTIQGPGTALLTIDGNDTFPLITAQDGSLTTTNVHLQISGIRFTDGAPALVSQDSLTVENCAFDDNNHSGFAGGAILAGVNAGSDFGVLVVRNSVFTSNSINSNGGAIFHAGSLGTIENCLFVNNSCGTGGGGGALAINAPSVVTNVTNCTFVGNASAGGGGAIDTRGTFTLQNCTIVENISAASGGGVQSGAGTLTLRNTICTNNIAPINPNISGTFSGTNNITSGNPLVSALGSFGGTEQTMVLLPGSPALNAGTTTGLPATDARGFSRNQGGAPDIGATEMQYRTVSLTTDNTSLPTAGMLRRAVNEANTSGGDVITFSLTLPATISLGSADIEVTKPLTIQGAALSSDITIQSAASDSRLLRNSTSNALRLVGLTLKNGNAGGASGGGVFNNGALSIDNCAFENNVSNIGTDGGGAIASTGTGNALTVSNSTFSSNRAFDKGGAIFAQSSDSVRVSTSTFVSNQTTSGTGGGGGAIYLQGVTTSSFTVCQFTGNTANANGAITLEIGGGGSTFSRCLFQENSATGTSGALGVFNSDGSAITLTNCVFALNRAGTGAGAIGSSGTPNMQIVNCTVAENTSTSGTGGILGGSSVTLRNAIVIYNSTPNISGGITAGTTSITSEAAFVAYPFFSPKNLRLLPDAAAAINTGTSGGATPTVDFDGSTRPSPPNTNPCIGAFEAVPNPSASVTANASASSGTVTLNNAATGIALTLTGVVPTDAGFRLIRYSAGRTGTIPTVNASPYYWIISTRATELSGTASFNWSGLPFGGGVSNPAAVQLYQRTGFGRPWTLVSGTTTVNPTITTPTTTTASLEFALGSDASNPLPVELSEFAGRTVERGVELRWTTASEKNNAGFMVERRTEYKERKEWSALGFVKGSGTTSEAQSYSFVDRTASGKVSYRLKQIDFDGAFEYSPIVEVDAGVPRTFELSQNYPNPFNPSTVISYQLPVSSDVKLAVYDMLGREIATLVNARQEAGRYQAQFSAASLSSGLYFYRLQAGSFTRTMKMTLVK